LVDATLYYLTFVVIILLLGLLSTILSSKFGIPNLLSLLLIGVFLNNITYKGQSIAAFSPLFLTTISILALVMIVFDAASRFKVRDLNALSVEALKLAVIFLVLNLVILTPVIVLVARFPFTLYYFVLAAVFAAALSGTDAAAVLSVFKGVKNRITEFLEVESLINTPLMVLIPFVLLDLINVIETGTKIDLVQHIVPFLTQFVSGIGAGVLIGIIIFKVMRNYYSEQLSPLAMIVAALMAYVLAEWLGGNGVLAVMSMGLIFGSIYVKQKIHLMEFSLIFSNSLEIFVFILVGLIISLPRTFSFFLQSISLFLIYVLVRYLAVHITFLHKRTQKEKIFMTLLMPKGIAIAVVAFTLTTYNINGIGVILNYMLVFILYSIILASVTARFSKYFIQTAVVKEISS